MGIAEVELTGNFWIVEKIGVGGAYSDSSKCPPSLLPPSEALRFSLKEHNNEIENLVDDGFDTDDAIYCR